MRVAEEELEPPEALLEVARTLESRGHEAWAVGGAVRDALAGRGGSDWDLATDARPDAVRRIFRRTVPVGIEHGTVGVLATDDVMYEVTTFRRDLRTDGRHAEVEFADDIDEDLGRRDFTINALAWRPETEELRDPFGGREDLEQRILRAVGEPADRFREDYLRVLRGFRFAGRFELWIEERTREALADAVSLTGDLSAERVREELMKIMDAPAPSSALRLYAEFGVLEEWYPEIAGAYADDPRRELYLAAVDEVARERRLLRVARWLVPVAEEWEERGEEARALLERLKFSNAETDRVVGLLAHYQPLLSPADSSAQLRRWLSRVGTEQVRDVFRLHFADARAAGAEEKERYLTALWRRVRDEMRDGPALTVSDLEVDGTDLMELDVQQGPLIGLLLDELLARVLEDPGMNERERLLEEARELVEVGKLDEIGGGPSGAGGGRPEAP